MENCPSKNYLFPITGLILTLPLTSVPGGRNGGYTETFEVEPLPPLTDTSVHGGLSQIEREIRESLEAVDEPSKVAPHFPDKFSDVFSIIRADSRRNIEDIFSGDLDSWDAFLAGDAHRTNLVIKRYDKNNSQYGGRVVALPDRRKRMKRPPRNQDFVASSEPPRFPQIPQIEPSAMKDFSKREHPSIASTHVFYDYEPFRGEQSFIRGYRSRAPRT